MTRMNDQPTFKLFACRFLSGLLFTVFCTSALPASNWLTVVGNPGDPQGELLEVDPLSRKVTNGVPTLDIRVSRSMLRTSTDGIPFRSYIATIRIDCAAQTAQFAAVTFYMMPFWEGKSHSTLSFSASEIRPLLFRLFEPSPTLKVVRAACIPTKS